MHTRPIQVTKGNLRSEKDHLCLEVCDFCSNRNHSTLYPLLRVVDIGAIFAKCAAVRCTQHQNTFFLDAQKVYRTLWVWILFQQHRSRASSRDRDWFLLRGQVDLCWLNLFINISQPSKGFVVKSSCGVAALNKKPFLCRHQTRISFWFR